MKLTHFRDTSQDPTVAPRLQQQAADMFDPLLSPCLVQLQCAGDGSKPLGSMVIIDDTSDLDPTTVDEKLPQGVLPVGRLDLACIADVNDLGNRIAATTNRRLQEIGQLVRKCDLIGFRRAAQEHRAKLLPIGQYTDASDAGHLEEAPRRQAECHTVTTDRQHRRLFVLASLADQFHQLLNLSLLAKRFHAAGERADEVPKFLSADLGSRLIGDHLQCPALRTSTARELLSNAIGRCRSEAVLNAKGNLQREDHPARSAAPVPGTPQRDLSKPGDDIRAKRFVGQTPVGFLAMRDGAGHFLDRRLQLLKEPLDQAPAQFAKLFSKLVLKGMSLLWLRRRPGKALDQQSGLFLKILGHFRGDVPFVVKTLDGLAQ